MRSRLRLGAAFAVAVLLAGCVGQPAAPPVSTPSDGAPAAHLPGALHPDLAEDVRAEFLRAYLAYERLAGDHDELQPIAGKGSDFFAEGHPVRLATIEALDTMYLMGLDEVLQRSVARVCEVSYDIDADFQVFETIIRVVGGLLSGYHATGEPCLLDHARDMADRLLPAFTKSPTGLPYRYVNLHTSAVSGTRNVLAEIGSCVTEFGDLSRITGDPRYLDAAKAAQKAVFDRRSALDLVGTEIDIETGAWVGTTVESTINPPVDSFFEYLWDAADFLGDEEERGWFETLNGALLRRQSVQLPTTGSPVPRPLPLVPDATALWFSTAEYQTGAPTSTLQSELASFYAGLLAQAGHVAEGRAYHDAWAGALDRGGWRILPECLEPATMQAVCKGNSLRPEYVDAALFLWLATNDTVFVDRAVAYYENMKATSRVADGYTSLRDVTTRPETQGDSTPAYWYSENMKYFYLLFGRPARFDYADNYLTTEGNVLRGLLPPRP